MCRWPTAGAWAWLFGTNQMEQEKMEEIESLQSSETDKYN